MHSIVRPKLGEAHRPRRRQDRSVDHRINNLDDLHGEYYHSLHLNGTEEPQLLGRCTLAARGESRSDFQ